MSIDTAINKTVAPFADSLFSVVFASIDIWTNPDGSVVEMPIILVWLLMVGIFFSFYLGFPNIRYFKHAVDVIRGKYDTKKAGDGSINRFQALATTLSGTVGLGNIAGVAVAISVGGPGAVVWMVFMGLIGMTTKFVECALGVKYRIKLPDGNFSGGPMYYLDQCLRNTTAKHLGSFLAGLFAVCCIAGAIGGGNLFQSNQAYEQLVNVTGGAEMSFFADKGWLVGLILGGLVASVILGGIKSIARVTSKIVPIMGAIYVGTGLIVIIINYQNIGPAFAAIFAGAFTFQSGLGGLLGAIIMGIQRGAFSNEAGFGSAAIGHAAAQTKDHVSQGFVAMLGPFIDTIIICTVTGLVITISGVYETYTDGMAGVALTSKAFADTISWFPYLLALSVFLFAFSTMISWSYYGVKATMFLFGESPIARDAFKVFFCLCTIVGTTVDLNAVIKLTDAMIFAMALPNIIGMYILASEFKGDLKAYTKKMKI